MGLKLVEITKLSNKRKQIQNINKCSVKHYCDIIQNYFNQDILLNINI